MTYWKPNSQQVRSFVGWKPQFEMVKGPATFWSFSSRKDRLDGDPMYWMDNNTFYACIEKAQQQNDIECLYEFIRQSVALREDWGNNLMWAFELKLAEGESLKAWVGLAKAQQTAMKARRLQERAKSGMPLVFWGGVRQYLINQSECDIELMISQPCLTSTLFENQKSPNKKIQPTSFVGG